MLSRLLITLIVLAAIAAGIFYWLTQPMTVAAVEWPEGDAARGETVFWTGGCASCHAVPKAENDDLLKLAGGLALKTPFGTFYAPNISPDPTAGIGDWSGLDFVNAMTRGVSPDGRHYYPAFPYTSYQRMTLADLADLKAFLDGLPPVEVRAPNHDLPFPFNIRRGLGLWKTLHLNGQPFQPDPASDDVTNRGKYLVEGPGHCGECHTPRDFSGGLDRSLWLSGAPNPEGKGYIPNITSHENGIASWSENDIAFSLETGFTPEFDVFGSSMADVARNMSKVPAEDRAAIAKYLKSVPPLAGTRPKSP